MSGSKEMALNEKELGNAAYKKKDFETALQHYKKAIDIDPNEMTFYTNIAAVHYERKDYQQCLENCNKAIDIGRENRADYKLIAKALTRKANAYRGMEDFENAIIFYEKSLTEHRTPQTREMLAGVEKALKERERLAYIDPEKSQAEKDAGNQCFKEGRYADAVKHYTEAIKRNPEDAKVYSNRAAAYTKLAAFDLGLKDCDECIRLDPKFIKGYLRKANILKGLKKFSQAGDVYQEAIELDGNCQEAIDGYRTCLLEGSSDPEEVRKRAMKDPEVQTILRDPAMRLILEQMQSDPKALQEHLRNPDIASKIQKLIEAGLIAIR